MGVNLFLTDRERALLERAVIGIAGAGGLGSNCAAHLVRAGIRKLVIADFDAVAESNLNRQFFFADQVGMKKVDALRENLLRIAPGLELELHACKITRKNAAAIFGRCDAAVEAFDTVASKCAFLEAMSPVEIPIAAASGIGGWGRSGTLGIRRAGTRLYLIGDGETEAAGATYPTAPRVGIAAAMQANTVIALLLNQPV